MSKGNKSLDKVEFMGKLADVAEMATNTGRLMEQARILNLMTPHLKVCNYEAVNEEACDVCFWLMDLTKQIIGADDDKA
jgi:hypothetical protein